MKDLNEWSLPLAAIIMYTFDLSLLSTNEDADKNFYFKLNKVVN